MNLRKTSRVFLLPIACLFVLTATGCGGDADSSTVDLYTVTRGDLTISVTESGTIKSLDATSIRSRVEGSNKIKWLIEEGKIISPEETEIRNEETGEILREGKLLVTLDSSTLESKVEDQEVSVNDAVTASKTAKTDLKLQIKKNESSISEGERTVQFARMDLEKYLGKTLADQVLEEYYQREKDKAKAAEEEVEKKTAETGAADTEESGEGEGEESTGSSVPAGTTSLLGVDYEVLGQSKDLGGGALQERRNLESAIELANEEVTLARNTLDWTNRLLEKGYVTKDEAEADALALKRKGIELEKAQTALDLFLRYDFAKNTEQLLSDYREALNELDRIKISCQGEREKAEDNLTARQNNLNIHEGKLEKYRQQLANCAIRATKPGLVVYANLNQGRRSSTPIQEGTSVSEDQEILTIPNLAKMGVELKIPEGSFHLIQEGLPSIIQLDRDSAPQMKGEVVSISNVLNSADFFMGNASPTYPANVAISDSTKYDIKPGMTANVTILIEQLKNVLFVSLQGIHIYKGKQVCYVKDGNSYRCVPVQLGSANENYAQIKSGLSEGDRILLHEPSVGENVIIDESQFTEDESDKKEVEFPAATGSQTGSTNKDSKPKKNKDSGAESGADKNPADDKASGQDDHSGKQSEGGMQGDDRSGPPSGGTGGMELTDEQKARMKEFQQVMAALTDDERDKLRSLMGKIDMKAVFQALEGKSVEEKVEYLRQNVLNQ